MQREKQSAPAGLFASFTSACCALTHAIVATSTRAVALIYLTIHECGATCPARRVDQKMLPTHVVRSNNRNTSAFSSGVKVELQEVGNDVPTEPELTCMPA